MLIGFHTNAFVWAGQSHLAAITDFALKAGYTALEIGPGIPLEESNFRRALEKITISNFIYCRNFISDDVQEAEREREELWRRMAFASQLGVKRMVISTGISQSLSLPKNGGCNPLASFQPAMVFLNEAMARAQTFQLDLLLENCPMYRNIATSPTLWDALFAEIPAEQLGLCYDASHFVWQMIDPIAPLQQYGDRIRHIHLKDTLMDWNVLHKVGILHNVGAERGLKPNQWWRHTVMGEGEIDWQAFKQALDSIPYTSCLSFEMEDHTYECEEEKVKQGLTLQRATLQQQWLL